MKKSGVKAFAIIFLITLLCLTPGCEKKQKTAVSVLLVLDEVPRKISTAYFEDRILAKQELTAPEVKYLKSVYAIEKDNYVLVAPLYEKPAAGRAATHKDEILRILRKLGTIPIYAKPSEAEPVLAMAEWKEVECVDPASPTREAVKKEGSKEEIVEWQKIEVENNTRWVAARDLLFKNMEETEGVVLKDFDLFKYPVYSIANKIGKYERGMKVKSRGFSYPERTYKNMYLNIEIYDKQGWCPASNVVLNARKGVMMKDETLFDNPEDLKSNRLTNLVYEKFDLVPVLETRKDGWVKVVIDSNEKFFYIKNGKDVISDDPVDIAFASYVRDDYKRSKTLARELADALGESDKLAAIGTISGIKEKLSVLDLVRTKIEDYLGMDEYKNSVFVRSGSPFSLNAYAQELFEIVNETEYVLASQKTSEPKVESKKGTMPLDSSANMP